MADLTYAATVDGSDEAWIDLAAAHLLRGAEQGEPWFRVQAFRAAEIAAQRLPESPQAWFNRALALEGLYLIDEAIESLVLAERLLVAQGLEPAQDMVALGLRLVRSRAEPSDVPSPLLKLALEGRSGDSTIDLALEASALLVERQETCREVNGEIVGLGEVWARQTGDYLLADLGSWLTSHGCPLSEEARSAIDRLIVGRAHYDSRDNTAALEELAAAGQALAAIDSPLASIADFYRAIVQRRLVDYRGAFARLESSRVRSIERGYRHLVVRTDWMLATMVYSQGDLGKSNGLYSRALEEAVASNSLEDAARLAALLSEGLAEAGRFDEALELALLAIEQARALRDPRSLATSFGQAAGIARLHGDAWLAIYFYGAALAAAQKLPSPVPQLRLSVWRGLALAEEGRFEEAEKDFSKASRLIDEVPPGGERDRRRADLALGRAHARRVSAPTEAAELAHRAQNFYSAAGPMLFEAWASMLRGSALVEMEDPRGAESEFRSAIGLQERYGRSVESGRLEHLRRYSAYDHLIRLKLDLGRDSLEALALSDQAKRFDGILRNPGRPTGEFSSFRVAGDWKVIAYHRLSDRVVGWVLGAGGLEDLFVSPAEQLDALVQVLGSEQSLDRASFDRAAADLFDLLLLPAQELLGDVDELVLVPDEDLRAVPFAGLLDRTTGRYVVEDHLVSIAPLAAVAVAGRDGEPMTSFARPLIVADPAFSRRHHPKLRALRFAQHEAVQTAQILSGKVEIVDGEGATAAALRGLLPEADFLHFAGHSIAHPLDSSRSALVLAPGSEIDPGLLEAREIREMAAPHLKLVVLSACATSVDYPDSGTPLGLVGAFLDLGARAVVGTLAPLDDETLSLLMTEFHAGLARGESAERALGLAQRRQLMENPGTKSPPPWAYVQVYRGSDSLSDNATGGNDVFDRVVVSGSRGAGPQA